MENVKEFYLTLKRNVSRDTLTSTTSTKGSICGSALFNKFISEIDDKKYWKYTKQKVCINNFKDTLFYRI